MKKVYMIGNTHFDPVWLWKWDEAMSSITATFRSALERMKEYPDFKYSFATPPVFEWIKKTSPQMFEEIRQRVREGRWELAEGWWVQPDCYSPSGEGLARQGLYGQKYLMENFGMYSETVFNIDSFGHPPTLPQILAKSRIKYYALCRPEGRHIQLEEPLFNWKSKDGTEILAYRDDAPYKPDTDVAIREMRDCPYDSMQVYGVTDHGGAPTIKSIEEIYQNENAVFSTVKGFFEDRTTDYTVTQELITGDFGVYANNSGIKAMNRIAEYSALNAEKAAVIAGNVEGEKLKNCWQDILFNQFHDILGGASIKAAYFDAENMYGRAIMTANEITHFSLLKVTNNINMPGKNPDNAWNVVVWNLNGAEYDGYIEAEVQWAHEFPWYDKEIELEDSEGKRYECQIIRERSVIPRFRSRFLFKAKIPSVGYKAFKVVQTQKEIEANIPEDKYTYETERYRIVLSKNGGIDSVFDKVENKEICRNILTPACFVDDGDTWAFNIESYGEQCEMPELENIQITESGALRTTIKATFAFRSSKIEMYYSLYGKENYADVRYRVNWNEKHLAFKLLSEIEEERHTAAVPYGCSDRFSTDADVPVGEWLTTDSIAFCMNRIFAYNLVENKLGFTVLRSPIYGDLRLGELDLDIDYDIMEQGITEGCVRVYFEVPKDMVQKAMQFNNPPIVLCEANHDGELNAENSYMNVSSENVAVTVLKKAEDNDSLIVRGVECRGEEKDVKIFLNEHTYDFRVKPYEIFTLQVNGNEFQKTDILEN